MRVLFVMTHAGYARNFESILRELVRRGHSVHVALERDRKANLPGHDKLLASLVAEHATLTSGPAPHLRRRGLRTPGLGIRAALDYLRFYEPGLAGTPKLRERAGRRLPPPARWVLDRIGSLPAVARMARRTLQTLHSSLPVLRPIRQFLGGHRPDVLLVAPLVELASVQSEYIRAARDRACPTIVPVASWDTLTNKGRVHVFPDSLAVWNDMQREEAVTLHGVPPGRIEVTGAPAYDQWFRWEATRSRADFCVELGLNPDSPFLVYAGSSPFIAPGEGDLIVRWVEGLRAGAGLEEVQILVRPHPLNPITGNAARKLSEFSGVAIYPPAGANPTDPQSKRDYFDSMHHSAGIVGVNTSAFLEGTILGRPIHALLQDESRLTQVGTMHFRQLLYAEGGPLRTAENLAEHHLHIREAVTGARPDPNHKAFIERFVRPAGGHRSATERLVEVVERLGASE